MDVLPLKTYPTKLLLELAFAAKRINQGYVKTTRRYSEGQPTTFSNKELISFTVKLWNTDDAKSWVPEDFVPLTITKEDRTALAAAEKHMRRYTMLALGNLSDFQAHIFAAYSQTETPVNQVGLIAYLPQFVERELEDKIYKGRLKTEFADSAPIKDKKITGELEILKRIYSVNYETYFYTAGFNGNLVMFSNKFEYKVGKVFGFRANVKSQITDRDSSLTVNKINYVKLIDMEN